MVRRMATERVCNGISRTGMTRLKSSDDSTKSNRTGNLAAPAAAIFIIATLLALTPRGEKKSGSPPAHDCDCSPAVQMECSGILRRLAATNKHNRFRPSNQVLS